MRSISTHFSIVTSIFRSFLPPFLGEALFIFYEASLSCLVTEGLNFIFETLFDLGEPAYLEKAEGFILGIFKILEFVDTSCSVFFLTIYGGTFSKVRDVFEFNLKSLYFFVNSIAFLGFKVAYDCIKVFFLEFRFLETLGTIVF